MRSFPGVPPFQRGLADLGHMFSFFCAERENKEKKQRIPSKSFLILPRQFRPAEVCSACSYRKSISVFKDESEEGRSRGWGQRKTAPAGSVSSQHHQLDCHRGTAGRAWPAAQLAFNTRSIWVYLYFFSANSVFILSALVLIESSCFPCCGVS